jgi:hypothetical protein
VVAGATCPDAAETAEVEDVAVVPVPLVGAPVGNPRRLPILKLILSNNDKLKQLK